MLDQQINEQLGLLQKELSKLKTVTDYIDGAKENSISIIVDFPDKNKIYKSSSLFPFFASRIPSLQRLKIQKVVSENITKDEVSLLKMFGKQSIANPYQLIAHN